VGEQPEAVGALPLPLDPLLQPLVAPGERRAHGQQQVGDAVERRRPDVFGPDTVEVAPRSRLGAGGVDEVGELREPRLGVLGRSVDDDLAAFGEDDDALAGGEFTPLGRIPDDGVVLHVDALDTSSSARDWRASSASACE